jgi:hypothetical protein
MLCQQNSLILPEGYIKVSKKVCVLTSFTGHGVISYCTMVGNINDQRMIVAWQYIAKNPGLPFYRKVPATDAQFREIYVVFRRGIRLEAGSCIPTCQSDLCLYSECLIPDRKVMDVYLRFNKGQGGRAALNELYHLV